MSQPLPPEIEPVQKETFFQKLPMPYIALVAVFLSWGTGFVATKIAIGSGGFTPMAFNGLRFAFCGPLLLFYAFSIGRSLPREPGEWLRISVSCLLSVIGGNFFLTIALLYINGGIAPVVTSLESSIFIIACFIAGEKFARTVWIGMAVGFSGLMVMFWPAIQALVSNPSTDMRNYVMALIFLLLTAACWGTGAYWVRHHIIKTPVFMQTSIQYLIASATFLTLAWIREDLSFTGISSNAWIAFFYVSIFTTIFGYAGFMYVLPRLPANVTATKAYVIPVISIITGFVLLGEVLSPWQIAGGIIILFGIILVNIGNRKGKK